MFRIIAVWALVAVLSALCIPVAAQTAMGTAFTYQGRLNSGGASASGLYSFQFRLFGSIDGITQIGVTQEMEASVVGGLFSVPLDFGSEAFAGQKRWLQISVKSPSEGTYTTLSPRVEIGAAPYALYSTDAASVGNGLMTAANGNIGLGTTNAGLDFHIRTNDTPAIRLEQTNLGGWTAQTWDIAGNEANFFVRDLTGGSRLPFRIRPGALTSSVDIAAGGKVGIGRDNPDAKLHLGGTAGTDGIKFPDQTLQVTAYRRVVTSATVVSTPLAPWTSADLTIPAPGAQPNTASIVNLDVDLPLGLIISNVRSGTDEVHYQIQNISNSPLIIPAGNMHATVLQ